MVQQIMPKNNFIRGFGRYMVKQILGANEAATAPEKLVKVGHDNRIIGTAVKKGFGPADRMAVEIIAPVLIEQPGSLWLFERAKELEQGGQLLFQSGKMNEEDIFPEDIGEPMSDEAIGAAMAREMAEELSVLADQIPQIFARPQSRLLGFFDQQRPDGKHWFRFYLGAIGFTNAEAKAFSYDDSISGGIAVPITSDPVSLNPQADAVYLHMFSILRQIQGE